MRYSVIARVVLCVIARLTPYPVIARRAMPDVAIPSKPTSDNVDSMIVIEEILHFVQNDIVSVQNDIHNIITNC